MQRFAARSRCVNVKTHSDGWDTERSALCASRRPAPSPHSPLQNRASRLRDLASPRWTIWPAGGCARMAQRKSESFHTPSAAKLRTRPPCPPLPQRSAFSRQAWLAEKAVMDWRLKYETHEEFQARRRKENEALRCKPRRLVSRPDPVLSLAKYTARLEAATKNDFKGISARSCLSAYNVPPFTASAAVPTAVARGEIPPEVGALWDTLHRHGIHPHGVVCHKSTWKLDAKGRRKTRTFCHPIPRGYGRVFVGRTLKMQKNVGHPMSFDTQDHVYVRSSPSRAGGDRKSKRRSRNPAGRTTASERHGATPARGGEHPSKKRARPSEQRGCRTRRTSSRVPLSPARRRGARAEEDLLTEDELEAADKWM